MSTNDVPGAKPENRDTLAMGAWAEHKDGSLILVEGTEGGKAIYSVFDMAKDPPIEYRDAMLEKDFKTTYSWDATGKKPGPNERWTWHDKTPFPWDRIVKNFNDGFKSPSAAHVMTAAERIVESRQRHRDGTGGAAGAGGSHPVKVVVEPAAETAAERVATALRLEGNELDATATLDRMDRTMSKLATGFGGMQRALNALPGQIAAALKPKKRAGGR